MTGPGVTLNKSEAGWALDALNDMFDPFGPEAVPAEVEALILKLQTAAS